MGKHNGREGRSLGSKKIIAEKFIMEYLIGIDVGTSGVKTLLINRQGNVISSATESYPLFTPRPLWSEQNPEDWWNATKSTIKKVLTKSGINTHDIKGIGLTGQMHGLVLLDEYNKVLRPCIMWNDQRTQKQCDIITSMIGYERLLSLTGNPVLPGFTAPKLLWVKKYEPEVYAAVKHILLPKDFIRMKLTGDYATDVSDASGMALLNVKERRWCDELLSELEIAPEWMPSVVESVDITGTISKTVADELGLYTGTPVVGGGGDQAAGAVGNGIVKSGLVSVTIGTSGVVFAHSDQLAVEPQGLLHAFCHAVPNTWHLMGVTLSAGGSLGWFRDVLCEYEKEEAKRTDRNVYDILLEKARKASPGSEGLIFLPYLTGERTPHPDPTAKGVFFGLSQRHNKSYLIRSVLEGVAYSLRDCLELMKKMDVPIEQIRLSGGGARGQLWRQIMADVFNAEVSVLTSTEGAPFGAALLAGVGGNVFEDVDEACNTTLNIDLKVSPINENVSQYEEYYNVFRRLYPQLKSQFSSTAQIIESKQN